MSRGLAFVASVASFCLAAPACSSRDADVEKPIVPEPITFASGSRLKARYLQADDVKIFYGWQDTKLGQPCVFSEGRCLAGGIVKNLYEGQGGFEDDACTKPISYVRPGEAFDVVLVTSTSACVASTLLSVGERIPAPPRIYAPIGGTCTGASPFPDLPADAEFVRIGAPIPAESDPFVRATEQNDAPDGRIVGRWLVGDDGSRVLVDAWDTERNEIVSQDLNVKRWYPRGRATLVGESTCPGVAVAATCKPTAVITNADGCKDPSISAIGEPVTDAQCPNAYGRGYSVGSVIPVSSFAEAKKVIVGSGRIRLLMDARADERPILPQSFFDTEGETPCTAVPADPLRVDSTFHCMPVADSRVTPAFSDERCGATAILFTPGSAACDAPKQVAHFVIRDAAPFEVGARIYAAWSQDASGACNPIELSDERIAYAATPLDRSRLAVITERTE